MKSCPCCDAQINQHRLYFWNERQVCERCFEELEALATYRTRPPKPTANLIAIIALSGLISISAIRCVDLWAKYSQSTSTQIEGYQQP